MHLLVGIKIPTKETFTIYPIDHKGIILSDDAASGPRPVWLFFHGYFVIPTTKYILNY